MLEPFIVLEGLDGSGKGTQIELLKEYYPYAVFTKEPHNPLIWEAIKQQEIVPKAELLLYLADRVQHIETVIKPALNAGKMVISDRFHYSTIAFQLYARGLGTGVLEELFSFMLEEYALDPMYLILDLPVEQAQARHGKSDRIEQESIDFHKKVREGYRRLVANSIDRRMTRLIDVSSNSPQDVFTHLVAEINPFLGRCGMPVTKREWETYNVYR